MDFKKIVTQANQMITDNEQYKLQIKKLEHTIRDQEKFIEELKEKNKKMQAQMGGHCKEKERLKKKLEEKTEEEPVSKYVYEALQFYNKPCNLEEIYSAIIIKKPKWKFKAGGKQEGIDLKKQIGTMLLKHSKKEKLIKTGEAGQYKYQIKNQ